MPTLKVAGRVTWNRTWAYESSLDGTKGYKIFATPSGSINPGVGYCVSGTNGNSTVTNFTVTYYLPDSSLAFTSQGRYGDVGWTTLARDYSKATKYYAGDAYYAYTTTYQRTIPGASPQTCAPSFAFQSDRDANYTGDFFVDNSVRVDGKTLVGNYGPVAIYAS